MQQTSKAKRTFVLLLFTLFAVGSLIDASTFEPNRSNKLTEPWRWNRLEELDRYTLQCGIELEDESLLFAHSNGLVSYDGYHATEIPFSEDFQGVLTYDLHVAQSGTTYLVTSKGLLSYRDGKWENPIETPVEEIASNRLFEQNANGLLIVSVSNKIYALSDGKAELLHSHGMSFSSLVQSQGRLFLSHSIRGLIYSCDFSKKGIRQRTKWRVDRFNPNEAHHLTLFKDDFNDCVYATSLSKPGSIRKFTPSTNTWERIRIPKNLSTDAIISGASILPDSLILFSRTGAYSLFEGTFTKLHKNTYNNPITQVFTFKTKDGNIIVGGQDHNVLEIDLSDDYWKTLPNLHFQTEDQKGRNWFINQIGDVISYQPETDTWQKHTTNVIDSPNTLLATQDGRVWAAGSHEGVAATSVYDDSVWNLQLHEELGSRISHLSATQLSDGRILFGSADEVSISKKGLVEYTPSQGDLNLRYIDRTKAPARIVGPVETPDRQLWSGGFKLNQMQYHFNSPYESENLSNETWVDHLATTGKGELFVGYWGSGLYSKDKDTWIRRDLSPYGASNRIANLLGDKLEPDTLWIATDKGICKLNDQGGALVLPNHPMTREEGQLRQSQDGSLWINQSERAWYFSNRNDRAQHVHDFATTRYTPHPGVPKISIRSYDSNPEAPANVLLRWEGIDQWSVTSRSDLVYSMKLNDEPWSEFTKSTETTLLSQPAGTHAFDLRVRDLDGNIAQLEEPILLTVKNPIWKQAWFILVCATVAFLIFVLIYLLIRQKLQHLLNLEKFKIQFFTNMSHELRTPLMLVINPIESLLEKLPRDFDKTDAEIAYRNSHKLLHMVDQILDFRKAESGKIDTEFSSINVMGAIQESVRFHTPLAGEKSIQIAASYSHDSFEAMVDATKLDSILSNVLSNAIKYTERSGTILVKSSITETDTPNQQTLHLTIEDDGVGIEKENQKRVFEPYYRVRTEDEKRPRGSGLGLPLVKSLLDSIQGSITIESPVRVVAGVSKGTSFQIEIPLLQQVESTPGPEAETIEVVEDQANVSTDALQTIILIADDEYEILNYLSRSLGNEYKVETASDGKEALEKAKTIIPDIIITDLSMPKMDGNELCLHLKGNESTSHIPIIALTALKGQNHELRALAKGANDFISKPVSIRILKQKISNCIESRKALQQRYLQGFDNAKKSINPESQEENNLNAIFVERAKRIVRSELENPLFDVKSLATTLGMSRMTLYRKISAITGHSPSDLIRDIRLNYAAELISERHLSISEIAYKVGYKDLSHFSQTFKRAHGCKPSDYLEAQQTN